MRRLPIPRAILVVLLVRGPLSEEELADELFTLMKRGIVERVGPSELEEIVSIGLATRSIIRLPDGRLMLNPKVRHDKLYFQLLAEEAEAVYGVKISECDPGVRVELVSQNHGLPLVIAAIKTSAGRVREKGLEYYLWDYVEKKPDTARALLREAAEKYPSVLEHWVLTFYIDGCSRACTHQLVRHRLASYTQESQRYSVAVALSLVPDRYVEEENEAGRLKGLINWMQELRGELAAGKLEPVLESLSRIVVVPPLLHEEALREYLDGVAGALEKYARLVLAGVPYEDARYVLPQSMRTRILVTANLREWLHILKLRTSPHAQWEIRCVMERVRKKIERLTGLPLPMSE